MNLIFFTFMSIIINMLLLTFFITKVPKKTTCNIETLNKIIYSFILSILLSLLLFFFSPKLNRSFQSMK